jgi:hypothetical protein
MVATLQPFDQHMFFDGGLRLVAEATGGATRDGDSVVGEIKACCPETSVELVEQRNRECSGDDSESVRCRIRRP